MNMFQFSNYDILYCSDLHEAFTVFQTKVQALHFQKGESDSPIHISTDEQISIHFGKASIQDERTYILKLDLMEITLLSGREDSPN